MTIYKVVANVLIYLTVHSIFYFKLLLTMLFPKLKKCESFFAGIDSFLE